MLRLTGIDIIVCRQCGRGTLRRILVLASQIRASMRVPADRPTDPHDAPPLPTTELPSSPTRAERALLRQLSLHPDESRRCELGVAIGPLRRQGLGSMSRLLGVVASGKLS